MSKIAEALAKAKERTGTTTAPFISSSPISPAGADPAKSPALRQAAKARRFWIALLTVAGLGTAFLLWDRLRPEDTGPQPGVAAPLPSASAPAAATPVNPSGAATTAPQAPAAPRAETQNAVNALVITAVLPGERPRLTYQGRIVAMGEPVADGLVFAGVHDGRLLFTDARGATYSRRY